MSCDLRVERLMPGAPEVPLVARWRHEAFFAEEGWSLQQGVELLEGCLRKAEREIGFLARLAGRPAGTALLIERELEARHDVTPWLAGLYVEPWARRQGVGAALVASVEGAARKAGFARLHLYTTNAEDFYARLGWCVEERFLWDGEPFVLMVRDLQK